MAKTIYYGSDPRWSGGDADYQSMFDMLVDQRFDLLGPNTKKSFLDEATKTGVCIFCWRSHPDVDFLGDSHAFPACCGNRDFFFHDECHQCNVEYGRQCEDQLGNFLLGYRALMGVRGRAGVPKLKISDDAQAYVGGSEYVGLVKIVTVSGDDTVKAKLDQASKTLDLEFRVPSFRPVSAIKSVLRSAWMTLGPKRRDFQFLLDIIQSNGTIFPFEFHEGLLPGADPNSAEFKVWGRKNTEPAIPPLIVFFRVGHIFLVWFAPTEGLNTYTPFPSPPLESQPDAPKPTCTVMRVSSDERVNPNTASYSFVFDSIDEAGQHAHTSRMKRSDLERAKSSFKTALECRIGAKVLARVDETHVRLSDDQNTHQTIKVAGGKLGANFSFTYFKETHNGKLDFALKLDRVSRSDAKATIQLLKAAHASGSSIWAVSDEMDTPLELGSAGGVPMEMLSYFERLIERVEAIEATFGLKLKLDKLSKHDLGTISILGNAIQEGAVRLDGGLAGPQAVNLSKRFATQVFERIKAGQDFSADCDLTFQVAGEQIDVGKVNISYRGPKSMLPIADVETKIREMLDTDILLVPTAVDDIVMVFERWIDKR